MYPFTQTIIDHKIIRTFNPEVDDEELKWHQDLNDREITILKSGGWKYQEEDKLPIELSDGMKFKIPKLEWHRVIKGNEIMIVEIIEK